MRVIHFAAECYPVAKVGGLADVLGSLPKYQRKAGIESSVVMPFYNKTFVQNNEFEVLHEGSIQQGNSSYHYSVLRERSNLLGFELILIKIPGLLDREEVYSYPDESEQFLAFQHAALDWLCATYQRPDIIHCHDHHAGLIPFYIENVDQFNLLKGVPTVATVHNGQYQGWLSWNSASLMPTFDTWRWGLLDWNGLINPLAALIKCCWAYTTVSEGYLHELYVRANGLEGLFEAERTKSYGIVNGIDTEVWDTATDPMLENNFSPAAVKKGKENNKSILCDTYGMDASLPLFVFIGRFALEKGADLLASVLVSVLERFEGEVNFFVLGSGDKGIEASLLKIREQFSQHLALFIGYNEELAHQVYAGADFLLMPSRVEPCGLNQLYAMRYGTVPVVHATGGLKDTVVDIGREGYGVLFNDISVNGVCEGIERALHFWRQTDQKQQTALRKKLMKLDFSWEKSAAKYTDLYKKLIN
ncbi:MULTISPECIES: glycogen synthase [Olivibacter]|jgi:starch synthase|uniref:Glycogen synthase n=1 Tax=Olivibacter oleidegradans TaxID=760123 RepID=A0ABV6HPW6_9SPHI|nr:MULTISPECIES: glycogen/starch synthase [Olivibacter]MDM8173838.1 glycogen/starch synthase [Olivibacter sp. 47]QEL03626.1 glycogen synthase [Olivibacter sp. LS-1]